MNKSESCFHCGDAAYADPVFAAVGEHRRAFCCAGCAAVSQAISDAGLVDYYEIRTEPGKKSDASDPGCDDRWNVYDDALIQKEFVSAGEGGVCCADLYVEGIRCGACSWLIRRRLASIEGVKRADLNYATRKLRVEWDAAKLKLSSIMRCIHEIGYQPHPGNRSQRLNLLVNERRELIKRVGVAGVFGMQIMVLSVALYAGDWFGMEPQHHNLITRAALLCSLPIIFYSAQPFFAAALRGLSSFNIGMDVPVSLGLLLAFAGSLVSVIGGSGDVYFDSVAMFCFLLLTARLIEAGGRQRTEREIDQLLPLTPLRCRKVTGGGSRCEVNSVATARIVAGDTVEVLNGDTLAVDGIVAQGSASMDESLLTGESAAIPKIPGDPVYAGSTVVENSLRVTVERTGNRTRAALLEALVGRAQSARAPVANLADRIARWFSTAVAAVAVAVAAHGIAVENPQWLPITIAVLVVTCPCALSLATPLAVSAAGLNLYREGLFVARSSAVENLSRATDFVFDKTGTLTCGQPQLGDVVTTGCWSRSQVLRIACALEAGINHPLGIAICRSFKGVVPPVEDAQPAHGGVTGSVDGQRFWLGSKSYIVDRCSNVSFPENNVEVSLSVSYLADNNGVIATFTVTDALRNDAAETIGALRRLGKEVHILSGDREQAVSYVADALGVSRRHGDLTPSAKLDYVNALQRKGKTVAMIGDGLNDAPVLAGADVSVSLTSIMNLSSMSSDALIVTGTFKPLLYAVGFSGRTMAVIRQNLIWALGYNLLALPAAIAGLVPPWAAALGMSLSSVIVVINASRLLRSGSKSTDESPESEWKLSTC